MFFFCIETVCKISVAGDDEGMIKSSSVESCHLWEVGRVGGVLDLLDLISMPGQLAVIKTRNDDLHKV